MRSAERVAARLRAVLGAAWLAVALAGVLAGCGGGTSTETTLTGSASGLTVTADAPTGDNTAEVVVDAGPPTAFSLGAANLGYVTVTVCEPGSSARCVSVDHVFLDTGSYGLRLLRSRTSGLALPALAGAGGALHECYPFVVGAVWGPVVQADVRIGGKLAPAVPVHLVDDVQPASAAAPSDCLALADGGLMQTAQALQAHGVLGIGPQRHDCGQACVDSAASAGTVPYYGCAAGTCVRTTVPAALQVQNPIPFFDGDDNGSIVVLPALPDTGAAQVRGRLVFGIGTRSNNQIAPGATLLPVETDPASAAYTYLTTTVGGVSYPLSYIDSGSNGLFFDDATLPQQCAGGSGWYCPAATVAREARLTGSGGQVAGVAFQVANADRLFASGNVAFSNLGGTAGHAQAFVWGLPFFYGRSVYTAIWGQALATQGPWFAF